MFHAGTKSPTKATTFTFFHLSPHPSLLRRATFPAGEGYQRINRLVNHKSPKSLVRHDSVGENFRSLLQRRRCRGTRRMRRARVKFVESFTQEQIFPTKATTFTFFHLSPHPSDDFASATCLTAVRSRSGSDNPPGCHSLPSRRFATRWGRLSENQSLGKS